MVIAVGETPGKILFVVTAADHWTLNDGTKHPSGFWAEEFLAPYRVLTEAGYAVQVATPGGEAPVADRRSLAPAANGGDENVAATLAAIPGLQSPLRLADVDLAAYAAVYYPGGHGPMEDLAGDADSIKLIRDALDAAKPLALVCHGVAALSDRAVVAGRRVTGFSNEEETIGGFASRAPWLVEDRLTELGASYIAAPAWASHVVVDGTLITGQNPASAAEVGAELLRALQQRA